MKPTLELINEVDASIKARFVYVPDPKQHDKWRSSAKKLRADDNFQLRDDCDGLAQTSLHELVLRGVPKTDLYRAVVISPNGHVPDHMIGLVQVGTEMWSIGDTFGKPAKVVGGRVNGHRIFQTARLSEGTRFRTWVKKLTLSAYPKRLTNSVNMELRTSSTGVNSIKQDETFVARAYDDAQPKKVIKPGDRIIGRLTIGYGHTGPEVKPGMVLDEPAGGELLKKDLIVAEQAVKRYVKVQLTQNQFDALVSFVFNVGIDNFRKSTLLKRINTDAPADQIAYEFTRWNKSRVAGKLTVLLGLVKRRAREAALFGAEVPELGAGVFA